MILAIKRIIFQRCPGLGVKLAKITSSSRRIELEVVEAVVPRGRLAIDIGASWGLYTFLLLRCTPKVIAFEPNPEKAEYLVNLFRKTSVTVYQVALSDQPGEVELVVPLAASAFATIETENPLSTITSTIRILVPRRTLNNYRLENVGLMKIDVEGHEFSVLSGARDILMRDMPILYVRIERRHNPTGFGRTFELLANLGYRGFFADARQLVDLRLFDVDRDQHPKNAKGSRIVGRYIYNFLFLPPTLIKTAFAALQRSGFKVPF